ncbi:hypothetical protein DSCA_19310 [Desulfosarcina alkanivorans]|uniref:Uncharacterized protein n=1 Tax=Desulfosarcina alkanivorans TaxID=571177 RepID=A0A5K7YMB6_9BACT|nr:hypothetical protein DSCA_19310 [Desulfosarcina alkanivorans]
MKNLGRELMSKCESCTFRRKFDQNPNSFWGRLWKWHIGWCPGWKLYLKSLDEAKRSQIRDKYA